MKKKILTMALVAMSMFGVTAMAQTTGDSNTTATCTQGACTKQGVRKDARQAKVNPFEGLNLTDAQKAQLQDLKSRREAARAAKSQTTKADRQRNDSLRVANRAADKKQYLEEVKAIIGPDQYVIFLENAYVNGGGQGHKGKAFTQGQRCTKGGKADMRRDGKRVGKDNAAWQGKKENAGSNGAQTARHGKAGRLNKAVKAVEAAATQANS